MLEAIQDVVSLLANPPDEVICQVDPMLRLIPKELALCVECLFSCPFPDGKTAVRTSRRGLSQVLRVRSYGVDEAPSPDMVSDFSAVIAFPANPMYPCTL